MNIQTIETIEPMEELENNILAVQLVRDIGRGNKVCSVNKWYKPGETINIIKNDNGYIFSKKKTGVQKNVIRSGASILLSSLTMMPIGYYTFRKKGPDLQVQPAKTDEILRFARTIRRSKTGECLMMKSTDYLFYVKEADKKKAGFDLNKPILAEFHHTEDNLMWFEVFQDGNYSDGATKCTCSKDNLVYIPMDIARLTNLNRQDTLKCFPNGNRLIVELPYVSCETCDTTINRRIQKSKDMTISSSTKEACSIVKSQISEGTKHRSSQELISEALKAARTINKLLNGGK